jgi:DNA polymerase III subunit epsilon
VIRNWLANRGHGRADAAIVRWVVVDCETTGLDLARARLLAIGAVAVRAARIELDDSFSVRVRQEQPSEDPSIVIHGIGPEEHARGDDVRDALQAFADFVGEAPLAAFHAPFDRTILQRERRDAGLRSVRWQWLDLAELLPVLYADRAAGRSSLDDWLQSVGIHHPAHHDALDDAFATAQLLQVALAEAPRHGLHSVGELLVASSEQRWLAR